MWENDKNISDIDVLQEILKENNFDVASIMNIVTSKECKDKINCKYIMLYLERCFWAPQHFFFEDQISFGKDHLYQLEDYINSKK